MRYRSRSDQFEDFLVQLNDAAGMLVPPDLSSLRFDTVQIVGLPRTGTTLLLQLLAMTGTVGYPSNVMAMYHRAPWVGAMIQRQLAGDSPTISLTSVAGRTPEPLDPHEFGYFWRRVCGHSRNRLVQDRDPVPFDQLQLELDRVGSVFCKPVVYKNFLALAHASTMRKRLRGVKFLVLHRDPVDVLASLLGVRRKIGVPPLVSFGVEPADVPSSHNELDTVSLQVAALERAKDTMDLDADAHHVPFGDLLDRPKDTVASLLEFLGVPANVDRLPAHVSVPRSATDPTLVQALARAEAILDRHRSRGEV